MRRSRPRPLGGLPLGGVPSPGLPLPGLPLPAGALDSATQADGATTSDHARPVGPAPALARVRRHRGGGGPRLGSSRTLKTVGSLVVCLLLAGFGFFLSRGARADVVLRARLPRRPRQHRPRRRAQLNRTSWSPRAAPGIRQASLAAQVRARLAASGGARSGSVNVPGPRSSSAAASSGISSALGSAPSAGLRGCVLRLTGGALPRLVDRATYQGEAAYIIASSSRVWVAGLGCTAADTEVIASVPLAGLPGESPRPSIG